MDLSLVFLLLLHSLVTVPLAFQETQADQLPTIKYSVFTNSKDVKEDMKRRRKQARVQPISLKPPPQDWPEPELAAGDFIVVDQPDATSLSPLLAYQAKLEQEYVKQRQEKLQELGKNENTEKTLVASEFTSTEEEWKKLLDPDELLKHNKQLRPFVNQGNKRKSTGEKVVSAEKQGKEAKPAAISSLTALKAKTAAKRTRKKAKSTSAKVMTTLRPRRERKRKTAQKEVLDSRSLSKKPRKKKAKKLDSETSKTRRRKRVRAFAFAGRKDENGQDTMVKPKILKTNSESSQEIVTMSSPEETTTPTTENVKQNATKTIRTTTKLELQGNSETTKNPSIETTASQQELEVKSLYTSTSSPIELELNSNSIGDTPSSTTISDIISATLEVATGSLSTINEIRGKRKEMKQEMEKVLQAEELEGSFEDSDSDWTSSEKGKIPISLVTPKHALMGILKHKVVSIIDNILKISPKQTEHQMRSRAEKGSRCNSTIKTI